MGELKVIDNIFIEEIRLLINQSKSNISRFINSQMTILYWHIGKRIKEEIIQDNKAEYGTQTIKNLAKVLASEYGKGFSQANLFYMIQFYSFIPSLEILQTVSGKLSWSHIVELLAIKTKEEQDFYAYMAIESKWSVRELRHNIHIMSYERTLASQKSKTALKIPSISKEQADELMQPDILLKDPYILEFLQLPNNFYENELENAILKEIGKFLLELGTGFSFLARQKRITVDGDHFYIDLLFYNRKLKRMIVLELKKGKFKPEYKGQMEFYLNYLKEHETLPGEEAPIGIILCTEKSHSQVQLMDLLNSGIHVAEYWTELPPREVFERKVQEIVLQAKENIARLSNKSADNDSE